MGAIVEATTERTADREAVRAQLEIVLRSASFAGSERHRRFLRFVVEETLGGRNNGIKESVVALAVFDRGDGFDPRTDSTVRVEARNLRSRLNEYYLHEGASDPWMIDLPKGTYVPVFRRRAEPAGNGKSSNWKAWAAVAAALLATALVAWWILWRPGGQASLAILPFAGDVKDDLHVSDGFVEDLTSELARLPKLHLAARGSAARFRGHTEDARTIGEKLGVSRLLEGSVRLENTRLRVTVQLIDARSGYYLWSHHYERDVAAVQDVVEEVASAVSGQLGLVRSVRKRLHTAPQQAREAYWRGRYLLQDWRTRKEAAKYLEDALRTDAEFAEAWAVLAFTRSVMAFHAEGPVPELAAQTHQAAERALALDPERFEAHQALALLAYSIEHDWPAAERSYQRALELNPNAASTHRGYSLALMSRGRFDDALRELNAAFRLDPLSVLSSNEEATILLCAGRYEDSAKVALRHLQMAPSFYFARIVLGAARAEQGRLDEAAREFEEVLARQGRQPSVVGRLGNALARRGKTSEARRLLQEVRESPHASAMILTGLGEPQAALHQLGAAAKAGDVDVIFAGVDPVFAPLRKASEYAVLRQQMRLP